jgi:hypothetical protein
VNQPRIRIALRASAVGLVAVFAFSIAASPQSTATLKASPRKLNFGAQVVLPPNGTSSKPKNVVLHVPKKASGPVTITGITITAVAPFDPGQFVLTPANPCPTPIAPGQKCVVPIVFTPNSAGKQSAALTITSDASNTVAPITLSGVGRPGKLVFAPHALSFGKVPSGSSSATPKTVTLTNKNPVQMTLGDPSIDNPLFQIQSSTCGTTLPASGGTCEISVVFAPQTTGTQKGSLLLTGNFVSPRVVHLTGVGKPAPTPTAGPGGGPTPGSAMEQYLPLLQ